MDRYMSVYEFKNADDFASYEEEVQRRYETVTRTLIRENLIVTAMESCTGGMIASLLSDTEGASAVFRGSFVTYSNEAKISCGVPEHVIRTCGVYSAETAEAMAHACRNAYEADLAVGITGSFGNADPANADSVPGEIYIAVTFRDEMDSRQYTLPLGLKRRSYKVIAADLAAGMILEMLKRSGIAPEPIYSAVSDCMEGK